MAGRLSLTRRGRVVLGVAVALALAGAAWSVLDPGGRSAASGPTPTATATPPSPIHAEPTVRTPEDGAHLIGPDPAAAVVAAVRGLVETAPVLVAVDEAVDRAGRRVAAELGVPAVPSTADLAPLLDRLGTRVVVHVVPAEATTPSPPPVAVGDRDLRTVPVHGAHIDRGGLEDLRPAPPAEDGGALLLVPADDPARAMLASVARATGHRLLPVEGALVDAPAAISTLQDLGRVPWAAAGTDGAWSGRRPDLLAWDVPVVRRGAEVPGGGYRVFPGRRLVALYGSPGAPSLGVLGEQPLDAAIERARTRAADYAELVEEPVVPAFEIISTVATGAAGPDGDYSREIPVEQLRPWVERAADEDMYVILDLQPGRTDFLAQARRYEELLAHSHVGLALDPEWRLDPDQRHLEQIGSVDVDEVQRVADWLAELTRREGLPQKLLLLHQFRRSMLPDVDRLQLPPELAVTIQMDGQGPQAVKMATWRNVTDGPVPDGTWFGWKNFYDEDTTLRSPADTFGVEPSPVLVSYQ